MTADEVRHLVFDHVRRAGSIYALSREWRIARGHLHGIVGGRKGPGRKVLDRLGLERVVEFRSREEIISLSDVGQLVFEHAERAGSLEALAREWRVSRGYLSSLLSGKRGPGRKVLSKLGLERVVEFRAKVR